MKKFGVGIFVAVIFAIAIFIGFKGEEAEDGEKIARIIQVHPSNMLHRMKAGEIQAFIAWEAFNAESVEAEIGEYLIQSGDIWPDHPCCVLAAKSDFANIEVLKALAWADIKATRFILDPENHDKVLQYAKDFTGKELKIAERALKHIKFVEYPSQSGFEKYYNQLLQGGLLKQDHEDIGFKTEKDFFQNFLNDEIYLFVKNKLESDPDWKPEMIDSSLNINIGYLTADLHQLSFYIAKERGYYETIGFISNENFQLKEYGNGVAVMEAFRANEIDIAYLGGAPAMLKRVNDDIAIRVFAGANNEGSAIIVSNKANISSIADLRGQTIAIPGVGTVQHFILDQALRSEGITPVFQ